MSRIRILFVIPTLVRAGAETQLVNLVNGMDAGRFDRYLLTFDTRLQLLDRVDEGVTHINCERRHKYDFSAVRGIAQAIDRERIDVVHCTLPIALLMGWLGRRRARHKPPLVTTLHSTLNRDAKAEVLDWVLYQWLMRACRKVVFVCASQRRHWERKFPFLAARAAVIYNGIDADYFHPGEARDAGVQLRQRLGIAADAPVACCVARFLPEKGHRLLAQALPQIARDKPEAHFLLAGDGPVRDEIEQQVRDDGLADHVHFLGIMDDVRPVLAAADLTIMPSYAETFSMTMLESLAMAVPIVATDLGGTGEAVIPDKTGLLVPPRDPAALAAAVVRAFDSVARDDAYGRNGRDMVERLFSKQAMIVATENLLARLATDWAASTQTPGAQP